MADGEVMLTVKLTSVAPLRSTTSASVLVILVTAVSGTRHSGEAESDTLSIINAPLLLLPS